MAGAALIFREHSTEADAWAEKGVWGRQEEWEDDAEVVWSDVGSGMGVVGTTYAVQACPSIFHTKFGMVHN